MARAVSGRAGYVYFLTNPSMPGLVKIGRTARDPRKRAGELTSASGVPTPFTLAGYIQSEDAVRTEAALHDAMRAERVNRRREFFRVDLAEAISVARTVARTEKSKFSAGRKREGGLPSVIHVVAAFLYFNIGLAAAGFDIFSGWKMACANAAIALFVPSRIWASFVRLCAWNPLLAHGGLAAIAISATWHMRPELIVFIYAWLKSLV